MKGLLDVVQTLRICVVAGALIHVVLRLERVIDNGAEVCTRSLRAHLTSIAWRGASRTSKRSRPMGP
jgi:hypothetical protein